MRDHIDTVSWKSLGKVGAIVLAIATLILVPIGTGSWYLAAQDTRNQLLSERIEQGLSHLESDFVRRLHKRDEDRKEVVAAVARLVADVTELKIKCAETAGRYAFIEAGIKDIRDMVRSAHSQQPFFMPGASQ